MGDPARGRATVEQVIDRVVRADEDELERCGRGPRSGRVSATGRATPS